MTYRDYLAVCRDGHRTFLNLAIFTEGTLGCCRVCGREAKLILLPPVRKPRPLSGDFRGMGGFNE